MFGYFTPSPLLTYWFVNNESYWLKMWQRFMRHHSDSRHQSHQSAHTHTVQNTWTDKVFKAGLCQEYQHWLWHGCKVQLLWYLEIQDMSASGTLHAAGAGACSVLPRCSKAFSHGFQTHPLSLLTRYPALRSVLCRCNPSPAHTALQVQQPGLVECVSAHGRAVERDDIQGPLPIQTILWLYE